MKPMKFPLTIVNDNSGTPTTIVYDSNNERLFGVYGKEEGEYLEEVVRRVNKFNDTLNRKTDRTTNTKSRTILPEGTINKEVFDTSFFKIGMAIHVVEDKGFSTNRPEFNAIVTGCTLTNLRITGFYEDGSDCPSEIHLDDVAVGNYEIHPLVHKTK